MTDRALGRHRAYGDAIVEAHMVGAIFRTLHPGARRMAAPIVVRDVETAGPDLEGRRPRTTDPIVEYAAVVVRRDFSVDIEGALHMVIRNPLVTEDVFHSSWVATNTSLRWEDLAGGYTFEQAKLEVLRWNPLLRTTSFNRPFDDGVAKRQLHHEPEPAPCLMVGSLDAWRVLCERDHRPQFWPGRYDATQISCDRAVTIWRDLGHDLPGWPDE